MANIKCLLYYLLFMFAIYVYVMIIYVHFNGISVKIGKWVQTVCTVGKRKQDYDIKRCTYFPGKSGYVVMPNMYSDVFYNR